MLKVWKCVFFVSVFLSQMLGPSSHAPISGSSWHTDSHTDYKKCINMEEAGLRLRRSDSWLMAAGLKIRAELAGRARNESVEHSSVIRIWIPHHHHADQLECVFVWERWKQQLNMLPLCRRQWGSLQVGHDLFISLLHVFVSDLLFG